MPYPGSIHGGPLPTFCIDIYETIIDCVYNTGVGEDGIRDMQKALCCCALTCQAWLPRSRFLLYQSITLYSSRTYGCNQGVVRRLTDTIYSSLLVADLIKHITISETSVSKSGIASILPLLLVGRLPSLHTLAIQKTTLIVSAAFCYSITSFPTLTTLSLCGVLLASVNALRRLLVALPNLENLKLDRVLWETSGLWHQIATRYANQMPRVRQLSLIDCDDTWAVLELLAPHVERLAISYQTFGYGFELLPPYRMDRRLDFGRLTSLTIQAHHRSVLGFEEFFSKVRADRLRAVTLVRHRLVRSWETFPGDLLRWEKSDIFEQMVLDAGLRELESVTIVLEGTPDADYKGWSPRWLETKMPSLGKYYRERLSRLDQRGLLRVACAMTLGSRQEDAWVYVMPGHATSLQCNRQYGVQLLDAIIDVLDKPL